MQRLLPPLAAATVTVLIGLAFVAARQAMFTMEPITMAALRYGIAVALVGGISLYASRAAMRPGDIAVIMFLGVLQFGLFHIAYNAALAIVPAARAAVVFSMVPVLTLLIGAAVGREPVTLYKGLGIAMTIAGVGATVSEQDLGGIDAALWRGDLLILTSAVLGSTYNVFCKPYLMRHPALPVTSLAMLGGVLVLIPLTALESPAQAVPAYDLGEWGLIVFLAIPGGALSFLLFNWALKRTTPTRVAIFLPLSPIFAAIFGAALLDEAVSSRLLIGLVLVIAGIWLTHWERRRPINRK